jgi:hypothetical protein
MAELTTDSYPEEYSRPPIYSGRLPGGMPEVTEKVLQGMTQAEALKPETSNG